jgi:hypothetical protein
VPLNAEETHHVLCARTARKRQDVTRRHEVGVEPDFVPPPALAPPPAGAAEPPALAAAAVAPVAGVVDVVDVVAADVPLMLLF